MYDLIIIGSGPAGLSAAVYARRAGLSTLVLEKLPMGGGQVMNTYEVDNYLGLPGENGFDLGMRFEEHAKRLGAQFLQTRVTGVTDGAEKKTVRTESGDYEAKAVILATGAVHRKLGVPGEEEFAGRGVSYCAACDGAFYKEKTVVVVGGGDVAAEDGIFLSRLCKKVYAVREIRGDGKVTGVLVQDRDGRERLLEVDGVFVAVGIVPESEAFAGLVKRDENGYLIAGEDCVTSAPGIFAAGDIRTKRMRQIVTAVADGANAVASVEEYLQRKAEIAD